MATNSDVKTLEERIKEAIVYFGGKPEDIRHIVGRALGNLAGELSSIGRKHRNNTFIVDPINTIKGNTTSFDWVLPSLENAAFKKVSNLGKKEIILIEWDPSWFDTQGILEQIDAQGFIPTPSPYVFGLGIQFPKVFEDYGYITSLDNENLFLNEEGNTGYLCIGSEGEHLLDVTKNKWTKEWWFAVMFKE